MADTAPARSTTIDLNADGRAAPNQDQSLLARLESERFAAILSGDHRAIAQMCHPDLAYTHTTALTDDRETYVEKFRNGYYDYESLESGEPRIVFFGSVALVYGDMRARFRAGEFQRRLDNVYLAVWAWTGETWQLLAYQPTARPTP